MEGGDAKLREGRYFTPVPLTGWTAAAVYKHACEKNTWLNLPVQHQSLNCFPEKQACWGHQRASACNLVQRKLEWEVANLQSNPQG